MSNLGEAHYFLTASFWLINTKSRSTQ